MFELLKTTLLLLDTFFAIEVLPVITTSFDTVVEPVTVKVLDTVVEPPIVNVPSIVSKPPTDKVPLIVALLATTNPVSEPLAEIFPPNKDGPEFVNPNVVFVK